MGKRTESKNKSSKKNYSFTGQRIIGEHKSKHLTESEGSAGDTTEEMRKILDQENVNNLTNVVSHQQSQPQYQNLQMVENQPQMPMPQMPQMLMPQMPHMAQMQNQHPINNFTGNVDSLLVNSLAPVNNDFMSGMNNMNLQSPLQMAQGLANLSKLNPSQNMGVQHMGMQMSEQMPMDQNMMSAQMNRPNQIASLMGTPQMGNQQLNIKNLASLM
jgi:hypothetical protein